MKALSVVLSLLLAAAVRSVPAAATPLTAGQKLDDCVSRNGGAPSAGTVPAGGSAERVSGAGSVRDLAGGTYGAGLCMAADGAADAFLVRGAIRTTYLDSGGTTGALGYPVEDEHQGTQAFQHGYVGWNGSAYAAVTSTNAISASCVDRNGGAAAVGTPSTDVTRAGKGLRRDFTGGTDGPATCALRDGSTVARLVRGAIRTTYLSEGGPGGWLGYPLAEEASGAQQFEHGVIAFTDGVFQARPQFAWGLGDQLGPAQTRQIFSDVHFQTLTSWYNGPGDLSWMRGYQNTTTMSDLYGRGYGQELVVWLAGVSGGALNYIGSAQFRSDMTELAQIFTGNGPNYGPLNVALFTEVETYGADTDAKRDVIRTGFRDALEIFHRVNPRARVSLGLGGYDWNTTATADLSAWDRIIRLGDYVSVQEMNDCHQGTAYMATQIRRSVAQLSSYGKPIQISHFKFWDNDADTDGPGCLLDAWGGLLDDVFTRDSLRTLASEGLAGWNFVDDRYIREPGAVYDKSVQRLTEFGLPA